MFFLYWQWRQVALRWSLRIEITHGKIFPLYCLYLFFFSKHSYLHWLAYCQEIHQLCQLLLQITGINPWAVVEKYFRIFFPDH